MADQAAELLEKLGEDDFILLVERAGGARLYVPGDVNRSELPELVGADVAARLSKHWGNTYIRVPMARQIRVVRYRQAGMSNRAIAKALGISESGVDKLIHRGKKVRPAAFAKPKDRRQLDMFEVPSDDDEGQDGS